MEDSWRQFGSNNQSERHAPGQPEPELSLFPFDSRASQTSHLDDTKPQCLIGTLGVSDFIPSGLDFQKLRSDLVVLIARIVVSEFPEFRFMHSAVPNHIPHLYSSEMAKSPQWYVLMLCNRLSS